MLPLVSGRLEIGLIEAREVDQIIGEKHLGEKVIQGQRTFDEIGPHTAPPAGVHPHPQAIAHAVPHAVSQIVPHAVSHTLFYAVSQLVPFTGPHAVPHAATHTLLHARPHAGPYVGVSYTILPLLNVRSHKSRWRSKPSHTRRLQTSCAVRLLQMLFCHSLIHRGCREHSGNPLLRKLARIGGLLWGESLLPALNWRAGRRFGHAVHQSLTVLIASGVYSCCPVIW